MSFPSTSTTHLTIQSSTHPQLLYLLLTTSTAPHQTYLAPFYTPWYAPPSYIAGYNEPSELALSPQLSQSATPKHIISSERKLWTSGTRCKDSGGDDEGGADDPENLALSPVHMVVKRRRKAKNTKRKKRKQSKRS